MFSDGGVELFEPMIFIQSQHGRWFQFIFWFIIRFEMFLFLCAHFCWVVLNCVCHKQKGVCLPLGGLSQFTVCQPTRFQSPSASTNTFSICNRISQDTKRNKTEKVKERIMGNRREVVGGCKQSTGWDEYTADMNINTIISRCQNTAAGWLSTKGCVLFIAFTVYILLFKKNLCRNMNI